LALRLSGKLGGFVDVLALSAGSQFNARERGGDERIVTNVFDQFDELRRHVRNLVDSLDLRQRVQHAEYAHRNRLELGPQNQFEHSTWYISADF